MILYELLTGTTPFYGGTAIEIMVRQERDRSPTWTYAVD